MPDPADSARRAGLHYVTDTRPGIRRRRRGKGFTYLHPDGTPVRDPSTLARIKSLAIPPAWTDVWICPDPDGHLQATGRDARRRKQSRYHPRFRQIRDRTKFDHLIAFAQALPHIRAVARRDLRLRGLPREKVLAAVVQLLEKTLIRVGNDQYARNNHHYGLTTLKDRHVKVSADTARFHFMAKSGTQRAVDLHDPRLAAIIKKCQELPGQELFQYVDDHGAVRDLTSTDVNDYLRQIAGRDFSAKDFRTWAATVLAAVALRELPRAPTQARAKKNIVAAIESVAKMLGNTRSVCRKCYVHPVILNAYLDHHTIQTLDQSARRLRRRLSADESAVLRLLQRRTH